MTTSESSHQHLFFLAGKAYHFLLWEVPTQKGQVLRRWQYKIRIRSLGKRWIFCVHSRRRQTVFCRERAWWSIHEVSLGSSLEKDGREKETGEPAGKSPQLLRFFWARAPTDSCPRGLQLEMLKGRFACETQDNGQKGGLQWMDDYSWQLLRLCIFECQKCLLRMNLLWE